MSQWGDLNSFRVTHLLWMVVWACGGGTPCPTPPVLPRLSDREVGGGQAIVRSQGWPTWEGPHGSHRDPPAWGSPSTSCIVCPCIVDMGGGGARFPWRRCPSRD